jgi:hypothetical protein
MDGSCVLSHGKWSCPTSSNSSLAQAAGTCIEQRVLLCKRQSTRGILDDCMLGYARLICLHSCIPVVWPRHLDTFLECRRARESPCVPKDVLAFCLESYSSTTVIINTKMCDCQILPGNNRALGLSMPTDALAYKERKFLSVIRCETEAFRMTAAKLIECR